MTRAFVLYAHPCEESFGGALHREALNALALKGWDVDDCDLYAENFNPVLSADERRAYHDKVTNSAPVQHYVDRLRAADALILSFPVWNFGYPAILKGFFDRVFLPGVSFKLVDGQVAPNLTNIRKVAAVTTYGGTRLRALVAGDPPRKAVTRNLRFLTRAQKVQYLALYDMNRAADAQRKAFLDKVRKNLEAL